MLKELIDPATYILAWALYPTSINDILSESRVVTTTDPDGQNDLGFVTPPIFNVTTVPALMPEVIRNLML